MKPLRDFQDQTFVHSIKRREITKNNFGMPQIKNKSFLPASKIESKDFIKRNISYFAELDYLENGVLPCKTIGIDG